MLRFFQRRQRQGGCGGNAFGRGLSSPLLGGMFLALFLTQELLAALVYLVDHGLGHALAVRDRGTYEELRRVRVTLARQPLDGAENILRHHAGRGNVDGAPHHAVLKRHR